MGSKLPYVKMKIKKRYIQYLSLVIGTVLFIGAFKYTGVQSLIRTLRIVNPSSFFIYLGISISIFFGFVLRWYIIIRCHGHNISLGRLFNYRVAGFAVSYLTPSARLGGEPVRTYFLVKNQVPIEKAISSVFIDKGLEFTANAVMTIMALLFFGFGLFASPGLRWVLLLIIAISLGLLWIFYSRLFKGKGLFSSLSKVLGLSKLTFFKKNLHKMRDAEREMTNFFVKYKRVFILSTVISFVLWLLSIFEFKFLLEAFGYYATYSQVFLVFAVIGLAYVTPIPSALGVLESFQVSLFTFFKKGAQYGIAVSLVTRIRDLMWTLYGLTYLYIKGVVVNNLLKDANQVELSEKVQYFRKWRVK